MSCNSQLDALNESRLCDKCGASIKPNAMPPFELETTGVMAYSAAIYEGTMKELIHSFKYKGKLTLTRTFIKLMADHIKENPEILDVDLITAVPLHRSRLMRREFNQSLVLANKLAREFSLPAKDALKKTKKTKYQNELSKSERLTNLKGAFRVRDNNDISGKDILLVDDVMTTGATLNECADTLLAGGAGSVKCFTLARGI